MFALFSRKKTVVEAAPVVRAIIDATTPNKPVPDDSRCERRFNRTLPLVITPSNNGQPTVDQAMMALTQDFSDYGLGAVLLEDPGLGEFYVSVWPDHERFREPVHFRCELANCRPICHGFWVAGFSIDEVMNIEQRKITRLLNKIATNALRVSAEVEESDS